VIRTKHAAALLDPIRAVWSRFMNVQMNEGFSVKSVLLKKQYRTATCCLAELIIAHCAHRKFNNNVVFELTHCLNLEFGVVDCT